ncbi:hypothetical protein L6452_05035 [Arctium lappa]|uniref:Uncharacterized protein n=1 Tax=Arctium lappa TaxID=4217 RepID=A0ACB9EGC4_ARCLA|nr:hypothetical protein L6452_05035 [Arctium lappa]
MEMVAAEEVNTIGINLTPPLHPLASSLHDSFLFSHCASCFSPLPPNPLHSSPLYCSPPCSTHHSPLHLSSAAHHLHHHPFHGQTSHLRLALLLLLQIKKHQPLKQYHRIHGLLTNRHKLLISTDDDELSTTIKTGARAMAAAIMMRDGAAVVDVESRYLLLEEAVLCMVLTNAVEVQDRFGRSVGVAVYDVSFSWINHSCSPNACYRFLPPESHGGGKRCLIRPASSDGCEKIDLSTNSELLTGSPEICGGPRIVVRSMKPIKKGEQVTIAYTDLLQSKELRQLDLWSKYRFTCCCHRCVAVPLTSVDQHLQEISAYNGRLSHDVGVESLTEYVDDAIDDYISSNDAESCCKKLEDALLNGFHYERLVIRLHPQHHLSLNCYTTLASAYKVRAMDENRLNALKMNRFSAAYSLLLALLTHRLFLSESSLIKSVSYYWVGAGEAVLNLARSLVPNSGSEVPSCKCSRCGLIDMFEANFDHGHCPNKVLDVSVEFLNCISDITRKVWKFLVCGNGYLEVVKDPVELRWLDTEKFVGSNGRDSEGIMERGELLGLSGHCLLYGGILANISGGHDSDLSCYVRQLVYDGDGKRGGS